ncbi:UNVERIFIED_CONTAM: hypothetical protein Scaly_2956200 [Sesamum calycinum]|uniref:Retrotransposon gag domain-containing protein n=1 Tax=Sesamum calycinum TaxID=2727403 RepID=A0AAW2KSV1_9LAMI
MAEELPTHFQAPSHLPAYDGTTDPGEHIHKYENATLLHRSFAKFSSLFQHQFSSNKKYRKAAISLFKIKTEEKETLTAYIQRFNVAILEVPTAHREGFLYAFTRGLHGGPLFISLAKKLATDFLVILARVEKYMNLEDAWLVKKNGRDKRKENEQPSTCRTRGEP